MIQQRQQEEEERQALLELEAVQELDGPSSTSSCMTADDNNNADVSDETLDKKNSNEDVEDTDEDEDDSTWTISKIYSSDELRSNVPPLCECNNVACALWKSDKGEELSVCLTCQNEDFGGWPDGLGPSDQSHKEFISRICTQPVLLKSDFPQDVILNENDDANLPSSTEIQEEVDEKISTETNEIISSPKGSPSGTWSCELCTFLNDIKAIKCKICAAKKSPKKRKT